MTFFFCSSSSSSSKGLVVSRRRRIYYFGFSRAHTWTPPCAPSLRSRNYGKTVRLVYRTMSPLSPASGYDVCRLIHFFYSFSTKKTHSATLYCTPRCYYYIIFFTRVHMYVTRCVRTKRKKGHAILIVGFFHFFSG